MVIVVAEWWSQRPLRGVDFLTNSSQGGPQLLQGPEGLGTQPRPSGLRTQSVPPWTSWVISWRQLGSTLDPLFPCGLPSSRLPPYPQDL